MTSLSLYMIFLVRLRGLVVNRVRRKNEVNLHWARLVLRWVTIFGRVCHLGM